MTHCGFDSQARLSDNVLVLMPGRQSSYEASQIAVDGRVVDAVRCRVRLPHMAEADVRVAQQSDSAEITRIQATTWRTAYSELLPAEVLDTLDTTASEQQWRLAVSGGTATVLVATEGPWTVGFCSAGPAPASETLSADGTAPSDADTVALVSTLLVEPRWGRRGHGGRLLGTMAHYLTKAGLTRAVTWVPEADQASLSFFGQAGWAPDGTVRTLDAGGRPLRELRLSGSLELHLEQQ